MLLPFLRNSLILILLLVSLSAQIRRETRAVWLTTNFRLDWPPQSNDPEIQKQELIKILDDLKRKNFNTVYFQVRSNGTVLYNSDYEPFAFHLVPQNNFDPLKFAASEAHKRGLEIHAWVNVVRVFAGNETSILRNPNHLKNKFPYLIKEFRENGSLSYWVDMGYPEVRDYLKNVFVEIVQKYNVDGIHLDFIRYPGRNFEDSESFSLYGNGMNKDDWRRKNINTFVSDLYHSIKEINPFIKLGAAPIGIYENIGSMRGFEGHNDVYQDSKYWLKTGIIDYIVPQVYWTFGGTFAFEKISSDWLKNKYGRQIVIGTAAYKDDVAPQLNRMTQFTRDNGADGIAFFRYKNIEKISFPLFDEKAFPVEYTWLKEIEPKAPTNFSYQFNNGSIQLNWVKPQRAESLFYYGLYSSNELIELFPSEVSSVTFRSISNKFVMNLNLRSINKTWEESKETSNTIIIQNPLIAEFYNSVINKSTNPMLLKIENQFYISLFSLGNDEVNIQLDKENYTENLSNGKNILRLTKNAESSSEIKLKFRNSGKTISLSK